VTASLAQKAITVERKVYHHLPENATGDIIVPPGNFPNDLQSLGVHPVITALMVVLASVHVSQAVTKMNMVNGNVKNVQLDFIVMPPYLMLLNVCMEFNYLHLVHADIIVLMVLLNISLMDVQMVCIDLTLYINKKICLVSWNVHVRAVLLLPPYFIITNAQHYFLDE
jgi:hypothetical protein